MCRVWEGRSVVNPEIVKLGVGLHCPAVLVSIKRKNENQLHQEKLSPACCPQPSKSGGRCQTRGHVRWWRVTGCTVKCASASIIHTVHARIKVNRSRFACFIDFKKVFDLISRELLQGNVWSLVLMGSFTMPLSLFIKHLMPVFSLMKTHLDGFVGKQGDVLSPTLFV